MIITVLVENTSEYDFPTEHGLSLYIETGGRKILFDTGQSGLFADNAEKLGIDLADVDVAVISHGHYDHGGGISRFLAQNSRAPIYISRYAFEPHYGAEGKYIGLDSSLKDNDRFVFTGDTLEIGECLMLYSCNREKRIFDTGTSGMKVIREGRAETDDFRHEQYLMIREAGKKVLISGCSHKGILNIMNWFRPDILVGGFHYMNLSPGDQLEDYAHKLDSFHAAFYTCHCTGTIQYRFMKPYMKNLHYISAGQVLNII